jgi:hypothetical protein
MAATSFTSKATIINTEWLNDVNRLVWTIFNGLSAVPTVGKLIRSDGTNLVGSTFTMANTYAVGDLLQATSTNVLTALSSVATGNALISGGVTTASSWGKIGLTTHVSGTLAIGNGGTGQTTANPAFNALAPTTTKGDLIVSTGSVNARQAVGTDGQVLSSDSTQTNGVVYVDNPSRPNLLTNPNWQIDQINEGALYTVNTTAVNGPDGWSGDAVGAGVFKLRTLTDPDNAALKCLEITCTTADASIAATDTYSIYTAIEGYDASSLMTGTASAQAITIQFKFKTNVTGIYGVSVANSAKTRSYYGIITVVDTSEHEYSLSLTMDTSGTWLYTNGVGLYLRLTLSAGSNFQGTAGTWATDAKTTTAAQCNFMSVNTNVAYLKRVQLIPGALVQAYRPADIQKELVKAQRQYFKTFSQGTAPAQNAGGAGAWNFIQGFAAGAGNEGTGTFRWPVTMRAAPVVTTFNSSAANAQIRNLTIGVDCSATAQQNNGDAGTDFTYTTAAGSATGQQNQVHLTANARLS